jgi:hypothetical protein
MMVDIGYVGSHGTHLVGEGFRQYNFVHTADLLKYKNQIYATVPITDYYSGPTADKLAAIWGSTSLPRNILLTPYPAYSTIQNNVGFEGTSIYHGMNLRVQKRYSNGFDIVAAYTFSKKITNSRVANMAGMLVDPLHGVATVGGRLNYIGGTLGGGFQDPDNANADRAIAPDDITHMLNIAGSYELPFGKGRAFLHDNGIINAIVGGWRLTANFNAQTGLPLSITCPADALTSRCNIIGDPNFSGSRSRQQQIAQWINPAAFQPAFGGDQSFWANYTPSDPRAWQFGSAGARLPYLRSPGFWNLDTSLAKQFHVTEMKYFEFRWEMFNSLNHQNLGVPNTNFCLPALPDGTTDLVHQAGCSFGRITNVQTDPRAMEFALKFFF